MCKFYLIGCLFILSALFFSSCKDSNEDQFEVTTTIAKNADVYSVELSELKIPIGPSLSPTYFTYTTYSSGSIDYLVGYNARNGTIDIFNLSSRVLLKQLDLLHSTSTIKDLDKQDLDKGKSITDISVISLDSIILNYSNQKLLLMDTSGQKKQEFEIDNLLIDNGIDGRPISYSNNFRMFLYDGKLLFNIVHNNFKWKNKVPVVCGFQLFKREISLIPITFSDYLYTIKGNAGYLTAMVTSEYQKKGFITYSFLYESNIYQYNSKDSTITTFGGRMSDGKNLVDSINYKSDTDLKRWNIHNIENTQFFNVIYDKFRNLYYRFSLKGIPYESGKYFSSIVDKSLVLMIFNEKFEVIKEIELPKYSYAPNTWFVTKDGLFISPNHKKNLTSDSTHLSFKNFKIFKNATK